MRESRHVIAVGRDGLQVWRRKYRGIDGALAAARHAAGWGEAMIERRGRLVRHVTSVPRVENHAAERPRAA